MYELEYLYEQLKSQEIQQMYIKKLDSISESCYDTTELDKAIAETVQMIEEASNKNKFTFIDKMKAKLTKVETILKKYKDAALKCKPIGLEYKGFKTLISKSELQKRHKKAVDYLNTFNIDKASADQLKQYIIDSQHNVQYKEIIKIFLGKDENTYKVQDMIILDKKDKEITKNDISKAVKFIESYDKNIKELQDEYKRIDKEFTAYVTDKENNTLGMNKTNTDDIDRLRKNAKNHKVALINIADSFYYENLYFINSYELEQAKRIVIKAANYNPRNIKESAVIQYYIDAMMDFNESSNVLETKLFDKRRKNVVTPNQLMNKHIKKMNDPHQLSTPDTKEDNK